MKSGMDLEYLKQFHQPRLYWCFKSSNINLQLLVTEAICCCTHEWYLGWEKVSCVERLKCVYLGWEKASHQKYIIMGRCV